MDASLGTVANALKGAAVLGTNGLVSIYETVTDRKGAGEILRAQYGYGDWKQKLQLFGIVTGAVGLNLEESAEFDAKTEKKGLRRVVTLAGYHDGMSVEEQLQMGIVLGHEAYRNGTEDENNGAETVAAVKGHTEMGARMVKDGKYAVLTRSLVDDLNAYFDKSADFAEYAGGKYDASADYLKLITRSDGMSWFEPDGRKDLTITSLATNAEGQWETVGTKTEEMPETWSEAETLAFTLGEERVNELLKQRGISMTDGSMEEKGRALLAQYKTTSKRLTFSDTPLNGYVNVIADLEKLQVEASVTTATLFRYELSYSAVQGLGKYPTAENNKALDVLVFAKDYINSNKQTETLISSHVQSVDVYGNEEPRGDNRHQATGMFVNGKELEGNTVVSDFSLRVANGKTELDNEKVMVIHNALALNGRFIDKTGNNTETGGGAWLVHDSQFQVSDGCFILPTNEILRLREALKKWGLENGDEITGKLVDYSGYKKPLPTPKPVFQIPFKAPYEYVTPVAGPQWY
jgi:hypothetical protein